MTIYTNSISKLFNNKLFDEFPESDFFKETLKSISSTQQLNLDWSKFENHTFFNSAVSNVNTAFDKLVNGYPIDGTKKETIDFINSLTGFEKYVLDSFPKNTGFLEFDKALSNYINVKDIKNSGIVIKESSPTKGERGLNPENNSFSIEMKLNPNGVTNLNQIVFQKLENTNIGFTIALEASVDLTTCNLLFIVTTAEMTSYISAPIKKSEWNHVVAVFDRSASDSTISVTIDGTKITNDTILEMFEISPTTNYLKIGTGNTTTYQVGLDFSPAETFDGYIDELRYYHKALTWSEIEPKINKELFQDDDLILYFRFNEPYDVEESVNTPSVVIDSSGNGYHSIVDNFTPSLRDNSLIDNPMHLEDDRYFPILFPNNTLVKEFNNSLLTDAILYDDNNPNLITKLVPPHYFLDGMKDTNSDEKGFGSILDAYKGEKPNEGKLGTAQLLTSMLLIWGKFFDEIKIVTDNFSNLINVEYEDEEATINTFLTFVAKYYGFELPTIFTEASWEQFSDGSNLGIETDKSSAALSYIQSQIWRRILVNLKDIYKSKGTINSIKSFLLSAGVDPNSLLRLREYGGNLKNDIKYSREEKIETSTMLDFSGSLGTAVVADMPFIQSGFLSGSRIETGFPEIQGNMISIDTFYSPGDDIPHADQQSRHGISDHESDGLYSSGSFLYEGIYSFPVDREYEEFQSLLRINSSGTSLDNVIVNIVAQSSSLDPEDNKIKCFLTPADNLLPTKVELVLTGVNIFDGKKWNVCVGRDRFDEIENNVSSSYYLKATRQMFGDIKEFHQTSALYEELFHGSDSFATIDATDNVNGHFFTIGKQTFGVPSSNKFLNSFGSSSEEMTTTFEGKVGHLRMWSKSFDDKDWKEHVRNYTSLGVKSPFDNFNFNTHASGSFQRLRVDASTDQSDTVASALGEISIFDYSQNEKHLLGTGFEPENTVIKSENFYFNIISPKFDLLQTNNKVRARGLQDETNVENSLNAIQGLVHEVPLFEKFFDDPRFAVEFSSIDALNEDIIKMFSSLDVINDILGQPNLMFADSYIDLENLQKIYFNRLTDKLDIDAYMGIFKWFDDAYTKIIRQLLPKKTKYMGTNFIIESHMLERNRFKYLFDDIYMNSSERDNSRGNIFLSQIAGTVKKF